VDTEGLAQLTRILQLSITPVALISGVGLLLLSMTNRLGRVIDRSREVGREVRQETAASGLPQTSEELGHLAEELRILFRRARLLLAAIALIATSIFLAVLMVAALFVMYLFAVSMTTGILGLFAVCLLCLVASMACFLGDIVLSTGWLHLSLGRYVSGRG
jgi:HAMP domain-containing protein